MYKKLTQILIKLALIFLLYSLFGYSCNKTSQNNIKYYQQKNYIEYSKVLNDLAKNYVLIIESEPLNHRKNLFDFYKINENQYINDSISFRKSCIQIKNFDLNYINFLLNDSIHNTFKLSMIYYRHPFQSKIEKWDKEDNRELVQKVLIYDYFIERKMDYAKRQHDISRINDTFNLSWFKKWYNTNKRQIHIKKEFNDFFINSSNNTNK